jgi:hypothetical protein
MSVRARLEKLEARCNGNADIAAMSDEELDAESERLSRLLEAHRRPGELPPEVPSDPVEFASLHEHVMSVSDYGQLSTEDLDLHIQVLLKAAQLRRDGALPHGME